MSQTVSLPEGTVSEASKKVIASQTYCQRGTWPMLTLNGFESKGISQAQGNIMANQHSKMFFWGALFEQSMTTCCAHFGPPWQVGWARIDCLRPLGSDEITNHYRYGHNSYWYMPHTYAYPFLSPRMIMFFCRSTISQSKKDHWSMQMEDHGNWFYTSIDCSQGNLKEAALFSCQIRLPCNLSPFI